VGPCIILILGREYCFLVAFLGVVALKLPDYRGIRVGFELCLHLNWFSSIRVRIFVLNQEGGRFDTDFLLGHVFRQGLCINLGTYNTLTLEVV
jgi:hypothetical protein